MKAPEKHNINISLVVPKIGRLRPWEIIELQSISNRPSEIIKLRDEIHRHIVKNFEENLNSNDIEELLLMAVDIQTIVGNNTERFYDFTEDHDAWKIFIEALNGKSFIKLDSFARTLSSRSNKSVKNNYERLTTSVVSAYVKNNSVKPSDLPRIVNLVHEAIAESSGRSSQLETNASLVPLQPAISVKKSVTADYIVCLEDGRVFKTLKRHLRAKYDMSPEQYRAKWGLPPDYPMVAPNYAKARSELAKASGLGERDTGPADTKDYNSLKQRFRA